MNYGQKTENRTKTWKKWPNFENEATNFRKKPQQILKIVWLHNLLTEKKTKKQSKNSNKNHIKSK